MGKNNIMDTRYNNFLQRIRRAERDLVDLKSAQFAGAENYDLVINTGSTSFISPHSFVSEVVIPVIFTASKQKNAFAELSFSANTSVDDISKRISQPGSLVTTFHVRFVAAVGVTYNFVWYVHSTDTGVIT